MMTPIQVKRVCYLIMTVFSLFTKVAQSIELSAVIVDNTLKVAVKDIDYPARIIDKELKSGLPNDISLMISINQQDEKVFLMRLNYQIIYDLWDEIYKVRITNTADDDSARVFKSRHELVRFISQFNLSSTEALNGLYAARVYQLSGQVLVNPVKTERIDKIRGWIANSKGYERDPQGSGSATVGERASPSVHRNNPRDVKASSIINSGGSKSISATRPRFQKLFDRILDQYIAEDEVPALWHSDLVTQDISLEKTASEK